MGFPVVRRGILLAAHTRSPVIFIHVLLRLQSKHINQTGSPLYLLENRFGIGNRERKNGTSPQISNRNWLRVPSSVNDNYCVQSVARLKDSVYVSSRLESLNFLPVRVRRKDLTSKSEIKFPCNLLCYKCSFFYCQNYTEIKSVKEVSCVGHLSSVNLVTNVPTVALDRLVGTRLHQFWEEWAPLGASPKVVTVLRQDYTLPFQFRPNLTRLT